jgi:Immunoglobulin-like domain of bacterial spore germination
VTEDPHVTERLRRALAAKAETIDPGPDRLDRIEEQLMSRTPLTDVQRWTVAGVAAVATLLAVALLVVSSGDDDDGDLATGGSSSTTTTEAVEETTTTTEATEETTTTTTFTPVVDPFAVAFPSPNDSRSFNAPASAARSFATDVLGFTELVLGSATPTGEGAAEVVIQDREDGPETRVSVQQMEDGAWYVVGAETDDITVATPTPGTSLASPFETTGEALAFEGTVEVLVLAQDDPVPIGQGIVTGSGMPPAGPFEGRIEFTPPPEPVAGVLVYRIHSPEDGRVVRATAVPVRLTPFTS